MTKPNGTVPTQGTIFASIVSIMRELEAVGKGKENKAQGYKFRGIDEVYNAVNPLMSKHGVFTVPEVLDTKREERSTKSGGSMTATYLTMRYTFFAGDGSSVAAIVAGEGMDSGDKSTNKAMAVAHKYALVQVFAIPTEDAKDPENDNPQPASKQPPKPEPEKNKATINKTEPKVEAGAAKTGASDKLKHEDDVCPIGGTASKGRFFKDIKKSDLQGAVAWAKKNAKDKYADFIQHAEAYLNDTGLPSFLDTDPSQPMFGAKASSALMDLVEHATEVKTLDTCSGKAQKHLDEAEITNEQYVTILGSIKTKRAVLGGAK
jgi:hypothetical protein